MAVTLIFSSTIFSKVSGFINFGFKSLEKQQAIHVAEAGVDLAAKNLFTNSNYTGTGATPTNIGIGEFEITISTPSPPDKKIVTVVGYIPAKTKYRAKQTMQVTLFPSQSTYNDPTFTDPFDNGGFPFSPDDIVNVLGGKHFLVGGPHPVCDSDPSVYAVNLVGSPWYVAEIGAATNQPPYRRGDTITADPTWNGILYILGTRTGACPGGTGNSEVWAGQFNGTQDFWAWTQTAPLPTPVPIGQSGTYGHRSLRNYAAAFVSVGGGSESNKKYLYLLGGVEGYCADDGGGATENQPCQPYPVPPILRTRPIDAVTGTLNPWQTYAPSDPDDLLDEGFQDTSALVHNNKLYMIGGRGTDRIIYAPIKGGTDIDPGGLGSFVSNPNRLPAKISNSAVVQANGYVYLVGGRENFFYDTPGVKYAMNRTNDVYVSKIETNGELGPFILLPNKLPMIVDNGGIATNGLYIYYIGGQTGTASTYNYIDTLQPTCWRAKIYPTDGHTDQWLDCGSYANSINTSYIVYSGWKLDKSTLRLK